MHLATQGLIHFDALAFDRTFADDDQMPMVSRHLYLFYLFHDKLLCVQASRFSETDCPALSNRAPRVSTGIGLQQLPFVPGSRTCYRVVSHGRTVFVIVMQTRVAIRDRRRCNVVVVAVTLIVILAELTRARTRSALSIAWDIVLGSWILRLQYRHMDIS